MPKAKHDIDAAIDRLGASLIDLEAAAAANVERAQAIRARIVNLEAELAAGRPLPAIVEEEDRPLLVELITMNIESLQQTGRELRQAEAHALRAHGWSATKIAALFGVTRQRVSELLNT